MRVVSSRASWNEVKPRLSRSASRHVAVTWLPVREYPDLIYIDEYVENM